ncbi:MAG: transcription elongation factor GreA [Nannocystaceae bacterium]|nr:transcription elongation factor GreA [Nannocystaceae bacterium]
MANDTYPMTPAGQQHLRDELRKIKEIDRPDNVREIESALEHGDLRENAEYHAAKERQGTLEGRLRYLEYRLSNAMVIDPATVSMERVAFGATVTVLDMDTDTEKTYTIVGEDEADADRGRISITAPLSRAMLGKEAGDEATIKLPKGERSLEVISVEYKAVD